MAEAPSSVPGSAARWLDLVGLPLAVIAAGLFVYGGTLSLPFAYDDVDLLNQSADVLSGRSSWLELLARPHGDHLIPVLRLLFLAQASLFGVDATPLRLLFLAAHLGTAMLLARVAWRLLPGRVSGFCTALGYVGTAGLSSQLVWQPIGGSTPLALLAIAVSLWAVVNRRRLGARKAESLAALGIAGSVVCANTLFPMAAGPVLVNEWERRREGRRGVSLLAIIGLLLAGSMAGAGVLAAYRQVGHGQALPIGEAVPRAMFLLASAPFRAVFPWRSLPVVLASSPGFPWPACLVGLGLLAIALVAARWAVGPESRTLGTVAFLSSLGSFGVLLLVGLGRSQAAYADLYYSDRYFHTLALPLALLVGALGEGLWRRTAASARLQSLVVAFAVVAFSAHLALQRAAVRHLLDAPLYAAHARRFDSLERLTERLVAASTDDPLTLPDNAFAMPDVHNRRLTTRTLLFVIGPGHRAANLRLGGPRVGSGDSDRLQTVLAAWAEAEGERQPLLAVRDGRLVNLREAGTVDFRVDSGDEHVVAGLDGWDGTSRWMHGSAELRLHPTGSRLRVIVAAPWGAIRAHAPEFPPLGIEASLSDGARQWQLGGLTVAGDGLVSAVFPVPPDLPRDGFVLLRLAASRTWRPIDVLPENPDSRHLSVLVYFAGFED
jgi:hypothetical protein